MTEQRCQGCGGPTNTTSSGVWCLRRLRRTTDCTGERRSGSDRRAESEERVLLTPDRVATYLLLLAAQLEGGAGWDEVDVDMLREGAATLAAGSRSGGTGEALDEIREKLTEIAEGRGPYSRDQMTHAENTIEHAKRLADEVLDALPGLLRSTESGPSEGWPYKEITDVLVALKEGDIGVLSAEDAIYAALRAARETTGEAWEKCQRCHIRYPEIYWADDDQWKQVVGDPFAGLRCLACFCEEAQALGLTPRFKILKPSLAMRAGE